MTSPVNPAPRARLTRATVLAAALAAIDEEGLDALTMRRLGRRLGVEAMALYHHVGSKDELLDGVVETLLESVTPPSADLAWEAWLRDFAAAHRLLAHGHPHAFRLVALRPLRTAGALRSLERFLDVLLRAGFTPDDALGTVQAVTSFVSGFALEELADAGGEASGRFVDDLDADAFPHLRALTPRLRRLGPDERFAFGVDVLVAGLRARVSDAPATPAAPRA
jgi:AcrR family transcriptional regulator